jgi:hypothetical protein
MADDQKVLEILLKTRAELAGAKQLEDSLERQIGAAKALGDVDGLKKLTPQLEAVRGSIKAATEGNTELAAAEKESSEAAEFLHHNHRQLHLLMHEMGGEAGHLGGALLNAFRGPVGPALALGGIIALLKNKFDENAEAMKAAGEEAAHGDFKQGIEEITTATEKGQSKLEAYAETVAKIAQHEVTIAQALASQLAQMHAISAAREAEAKAHEAALAAETKRKTAAGELSPEQAVLNETAAAIKAAKDEAARKKQDADDEVARKQDAFNQSVLKQRQLDADVAEKSQAFAREQGHAESLKKNFSGDDFEKRLKAAKEKQADAERELQDARDTADNYRKATTGPNGERTGIAEGQQAIYDAAVRRAQEAFNDASATPNLLERGQRQYESTQTPDAKSKLRGAGRAADEAEQKGKDNAREVDRLRSELDEARAIAAKVGPVNDQALGDRLAAILSQAVEKLYALPRGGELEAGVHIADQIEGGKNVSGAQAQFLMALDAALGGHAQNLKEAADHVEKFKDNTGAFFDAVLKLTNQGFTAAQKRLDELATTVAQIKENTWNH